MDIYIPLFNHIKSEHRRMRFRRLKPTCAMSCVPARNPFGYVAIYAPALAYELCLAPHHISIFLKRLRKLEPGYGELIQKP